MVVKMQSGYNWCNITFLIFAKALMPFRPYFPQDLTLGNSHAGQSCN